MKKMSEEKVNEEVKKLTPEEIEKKLILTPEEIEYKKQMCSELSLHIMGTEMQIKLLEKQLELNMPVIQTKNRIKELNNEVKSANVKLKFLKRQITTGKA